ncbi:MAG TPA: ABC transporter permease [candidate division Zixibacteria bacterium]|mgnify:CR=1 FL=1|nr:ABC transporter permease [candidate division Zixibacteria bacterium]MDD4917917.1 ABC transporter permease [candidate division Zixibacteria bacterium]MDM7972531.1 ABC transporter permease [candidate division Zixibacteria bacterium]HOD65214.1 ABC transporter permease [candidate division Zixibacteria bacterium]HOZ08431.1 ABC transporter permease [candidate division Zixibacteria bacterium]
MVPLQVFRQFMNDVRRQKLRSALTMFGIFWGTCAIVLLFAFGQGIGEAQIKSQRGLGEDIAIFWPGITSKEYRGLPRGRRIRPTEDDVLLIKQKAQAVQRISPEYSRWNAPMKYGRNETVRNIVGVWPEFGEMRNLIADVGSRFLNGSDMAERRRVVFLGNRLKTDLFGDQDAVGRVVLINNVPFTVVGVMKSKKQDSSYNGRDDSKAFIPASTFRAMFSIRYLNDFVVQSYPDRTMKEAREEIYGILGARYRFDPSDTEALMVWDTTEGMAFLKTFFLAFQAFLVGIGAATLITGGIGVSNIMNVVLEERTKEIGIKMALGARKSLIVSQFVMETLLITGFGGLCGFLFAAAIIAAVPMFQVADYIGTPRIDWFGSLVATLLLGLVGFIAGIFPARRAANLQPVQALKLF